MGTVWGAEHTVTRKVVALKFLRGDATSPDARRRFLREARAANAVDHPNVVRIHDLLELEDGALVMVMDRLIGETLAERLERVGKLPLEETANVLLPVI